MTQTPPAHTEPSKRSTPQVDDKLRQVERHVDAAPGAGSPAIKPNTALGDNGKPLNDTPDNPRA